ncbi:hypothetical protein HPG69_010622 [Diceros bicornis minor]|uniref:Rad60/SUMO-like domain-containing protein n=1 Tax=Diceros bicornis minor TaxID=77932 RepID=A0A7J7FGG1_DICBM|nr:hypothetical protein HPG69_010622 [Diceros bicornis minor]
MRQITFQFDGQPITETDTPAQLDMEDEDTIDVFQQQTERKKQEDEKNPKYPKGLVEVTELDASPPPGRIEERGRDGEVMSSPEFRVLSFGPGHDAWQRETLTGAGCGAERRQGSTVPCVHGTHPPATAAQKSSLDSETESQVAKGSRNVPLQPCEAVTRCRLPLVNGDQFQGPCVTW